MKTLISAVFLMSSFTSFATFEHVGKLVIGYETGQLIEKNFVLAYRDKGMDHEFQVGDNTFKVSGKPDSYSIAMVMSEKELVWINEFSSKYFKTFKLDIGDYKFNLKKKVYKEPVKGNYVFSLNNVDYFFQKPVAQLTFKFGEDGIKEIEVDGMVASIGINSAESDDCSVYPEGSDEKKECEFINN